MGRRLFLSNATCICCLVLASMARGQENDASGKPQRLRDLFEVQQTVILRTSQDSPLYTIRLLSDEQTKQVEELAAKEAAAYAPMFRPRTHSRPLCQGGGPIGGSGLQAGPQHHRRHGRR